MGQVPWLLFLFMEAEDASNCISIYQFPGK